MDSHITYLILALALFAGIGKFVLVIRMMAKDVHVPWLTLAVPLHLFQSCRENRATLGDSYQWWSLATDFAILALLGLVLTGSLWAR